MRSIFTKQKLIAGAEIVVYAPSAKVGDMAKVIRTGTLDPFVIAECKGDIKPLQTQSRGNQTANVNRWYKRFIVKP